MRASAKVILFSLLLTVFVNTHADAQNSPVDVSVTYPSVTTNYQTLLLTGTIESSQDAYYRPLNRVLLQNFSLKWVMKSNKAKLC